MDRDVVAEPGVMAVADALAAFLSLVEEGDEGHRYWRGRCQGRMPYYLKAGPWPQTRNARRIYYYLQTGEQVPAGVEIAPACGKYECLGHLELRPAGSSSPWRRFDMIGFPRAGKGAT